MRRYWFMSCLVDTLKFNFYKVLVFNFNWKALPSMLLFKLIVCHCLSLFVIVCHCLSYSYSLGQSICSYFLNKIGQILECCLWLWIELHQNQKMKQQKRINYNIIIGQCWLILRQLICFDKTCLLSINAL